MTGFAGKAVSLHAIQGPITALPFLENNSDIKNATLAENSVLINEVELSALQNDSQQRWVELFNPTDHNVDLTGYSLSSLLDNLSISLPDKLSMVPGGFAVVSLQSMNTTKVSAILVLADPDHKTIDQTPLLTDRDSDSKTWQRIPDGGGEWHFQNGTMEASNSANGEAGSEAAGSRQPTAACTGWAGCAVGLVVRIAGDNSLYVDVNGTVFKVRLSLVQSNSNNAESFGKAIRFEQAACLGSEAIVDQDDGQPMGQGMVNAAVYCGGAQSINEQLLNSGSNQLDNSQCSISEFATRNWAQQHGC